MTVITLILTYLTYLLAINAVSFILMGYDKFKAKTGGWRVWEPTFYLLSFLQGYFGILLGAKLFHHKTRKLSFKIINLLSFILGLLLIIIFIVSIYLEFINT